MRIDENGNKVISKSEFLHLKGIQASYKGYVKCNDGVIWLVRSFKAMVERQVTFNGPYSRFDQIPIVYYDIIIMHAIPDKDDTNIIKYRGTNSDITGKYINNTEAEWYWSTSYPEYGLSYKQAAERNEEEWKNYRKNQHNTNIKKFKNTVKNGISKDYARVLLATLSVPPVVIGRSLLDGVFPNINIDNIERDIKRFFSDGIWTAGFTGTASAGMIGISGEIGLLFDFRDQFKIGGYLTLGHAVGVDFSSGRVVSYHKPIDASKKINMSTLKKWGESYNGGIYIFDGTYGGGAKKPGFDPDNYRDRHKQYDTYSFGISEGSPIGFTRNKEYTWVVD